VRVTRQKISIREVAARAGVSVSTVSLVLNGKGRISEATRKKVRNAAKALGFILDHSASKLRSGQSTLFGVIVNDFSNPFFAELSAALETEAFGSGYMTVLANSNDNLDRQEKLIEAMVGLGVGGFVICPTAGSTPETFELIRARSLPYVICVRDLQDENADFVGTDNYQCGVLACRHLVDLGHRNISIIGGPRDLATTRQRVAGFREVLENHGLGIQNELILPGPPTLDFGREMAKQLVQSGQDFTAVFCYNDIVAVGVCAGLRECGKVIGEDISVVGVDNLPESEAAYPALTTVEIYPRSIGQRSAQALIKALKTKNGRKEKIILPLQLIARASTAKV
jgi:DNA-binding LacI/PurR family transcriptional regulator